MGREWKVRRIRYLVFHRASSHMEELLGRSLAGLDLKSLDEGDLDAILEVVSLHDRELEEYVFKGKSPPEGVRRGLEILGLRTP